MKYSEFHRLILRNGWLPIRQKGSHVCYEKDDLQVTVPNHGSKEMGERLRKSLIRKMNLK